MQEAPTESAELKKAAEQKRAVGRRSAGPEREAGQAADQDVAAITLRRLHEGTAPGDALAGNAPTLAPLVGNSAMIELYSREPQKQLLAPFAFEKGSGAQRLEPFSIQAPVPLLAEGGGL
jgi:hypothetical protein